MKQPPADLPLIHLIESDDVHLAQQVDLVWFDVLRNFDWRPWRPLAIEYYEALWRFNDAAAVPHPSADNASHNPESKDAAPPPAP